MRALDYIRAGDIYQLNLAQRFTVPWTESPASLYCRLRKASPAAYGVFLGPKLVDGRNAICSVSPELFLKVRGREVVTCPIKGTRPLGSTLEQTRAAGLELDSSAKERAELNMIIDVERNDLGRVCEYGSVKVQSPGEIQELPTLLHRVATISGTLRKRCGIGSLLKATFPGGSITGAPKIRAMEIIRELEPAPRGPYCGAIGWLGDNGDLELNIAIRTALVDTVSGVAHFHAGSGIVADSDPEREYEETLHKARAFFTATGATLR
jgi:para-aminobenzoate synthetase component 1